MYLRGVVLYLGIFIIKNAEIWRCTSDEAAAVRGFPRGLQQSDRILEAEHLIRVVVGECFRVARQADHRAQCLLGVVLAHEVLQLIDEAALARRMRGAFVEYPA